MPFANVLLNYSFGKWQIIELRWQWWNLRPLANNAYEPLDFEWVVKKEHAEIIHEKVEQVFSELSP